VVDMTSKSDLEPGKPEILSKVVSAQVKAGHPDGPETMTVEVQIPQNTWEDLLKLFIARKWVDDEGFAALVTAGLVVLQTEPAADGENKTPEQIIQGLRTQLAELEAQCEALRSRVDKLHVLEWRDVPLVREELGNCQALVMRLKDEQAALQDENIRLRHQLSETGKSELHQ